ncbi:MAG: hypothetical protein A2Y38_04235 [Spirochaetes bacterium GWB1_59_5]|nr:MAG: hypothetical protein A2Y38_04235 [Spirochaetes bacterium GWB1_59_5]
MAKELLVGGDVIAGGKVLATKEFVEGVNNLHEACRARTTAALDANTYSAVGNGTLTSDANVALGIQDGVTLIVGNRLLVMNEGIPAKNGPYIVTNLGLAGGGGWPWVLTRPDDWKHGMAFSRGDGLVIMEGTISADTLWSAEPAGVSPVVGTDAPVFNPTSVSKAYVDAADALRLLLTGGTLSGTLTATGLFAIRNTIDAVIATAAVEDHFFSDTMYMSRRFRHFAYGAALATCISEGQERTYAKSENASLYDGGAGYMANVAIGGTVTGSAGYDLDGTTDWSVTCIVFPSTPTSANPLTFEWTPVSGGGITTAGIAIWSSVYMLQVEAWADDGINTNYALSYSNTGTSSELTHIGVRYNASSKTFRISVGGREEISLKTGTMGDRTLTANTCKVSNSSPNGGFYLDELKLFNVELSNAALSADCNGGAGIKGSGATAGIVGGWHFDNDANDYVAANNLVVSGVTYAARVNYSLHTVYEIETLTDVAGNKAIVKVGDPAGKIQLRGNVATALIKGTEYNVPYIIEGMASPVGSVTPDYPGITFIDTNNDDGYISTGTTNTDWKKTTP